MSHSRRHGWTKGPTRILLEARKYKVFYRARKRNSDGTFESWQRGEISMIVQPTAEDPEGQKALERRIRFAREKNSIEIEVHKILDEGDEVPLTGGSKESISKVATAEEYEAAKRKRALEKSEN